MLHGTTIATNAILEYNGAVTGMVTSEGYRDIIHIGRHQRPQHYSIIQDIPWQDRPLVRRRYRKTVPERLIPPCGEVLIPLDEAAVRQAARELKSAGVQAIAVCFLFSYLDPRHEERARDIIAEAYPQCFVTTSSVDTLYANTRNNPIEDIESHLPLRVTRYELREDMCGAGAWRGGLGSVREFVYLADGGASVEGERHRYRPWGFRGGREGQPAALRLERADGSVAQLPSKVPHTQVKTGDRFVCAGPAGGGYGQPYDRDPECVLDDVLDGLISVATARRDFGVVLTPAMTLDVDATAVVRAAHSVLPGA